MPSSATRLTSYGIFTLEKKEDGRIVVVGMVDHLYWDPYDWHAGLSTWVPGFGTIDDADQLVLEKAGYGKPFLMRSVWTQQLRGSWCPGGWFSSDSWDLQWGKVEPGSSNIITMVTDIYPRAARPSVPNPNGKNSAPSDGR